jgi:heme-degrading monooxygenase HmoA
MRFLRVITSTFSSLLLPILMLALLTGCAYTAPYRTVPTTPALSPGGTALLTLTAAEIRPGKRWDFFQQTRAVLEELPSQDGLLGYSFRFQIVGRKAWTMTVWRDAAAQKKFLRSETHRRAAQDGASLTTAMKFHSLEVPLDSLPLDWGSALRHLESAAPYQTTPVPESTNAVTAALPPG